MKLRWKCILVQSRCNYENSSNVVIDFSRYIAAITLWLPPGDKWTDWWTYFSSINHVQPGNFREAPSFTFCLRLCCLVKSLLASTRISSLIHFNALLSQSWTYTRFRIWRNVYKIRYSLIVKNRTLYFNKRNTTKCYNWIGVDYVYE